ncbi:hypothetical protein H845_2759 [Komagataeibacter xylinus E25]|nr:hypothetical protein H845_2759 [Komagataeibacter xylinus E25]
MKVLSAQVQADLTFLKHCGESGCRELRALMAIERLWCVITDQCILIHQ